MLAPTDTTAADLDLALAHLLRDEPTVFVDHCVALAALGEAVPRFVPRLDRARSLLRRRRHAGMRRRLDATDHGQAA